MHEILEFRSPNRSAANALMGRPAKYAGVAVIAAVLLIAMTSWSPRDSSHARAALPRVDREVHAASVASLYFPVPLHDAVPETASEAHIQAF